MQTVAYCVWFKAPEIRTTCLLCSFFLFCYSTSGSVPVEKARVPFVGTYSRQVPQALYCNVLFVHDHGFGKICFHATHYSLFHHIKLLHDNTFVYHPYDIESCYSNSAGVK